MPRILSNLTINEVSSVDKGAGEGVRVMLMKRADAKTGDIEMTEAEMQALVGKAATEAVTKALADANKTFTEELAKRDREITLLKMTDAQKAYMSQCGEATQKSFAAMTAADMDKYMAANPIRKAAEPVTVDDLAKRDDVVAKLLASNEALQKRLDAADHKDKLVEFGKRAKELGLTADGDAELMMKAYGGDAEAQTKFEARQATVLKALRAQTDTSVIFHEFGTAKGGTGDAYQELTAKAAELRKAKPDLSQEQAFAKVYEDPANAEIVKRQKLEDTRARNQAVA